MRIIEWHGPAISAKVRRASMAAIDEITGEAAEDAAGSHWWANRTTNLEAQIKNEDAQPTTRGAKGKFGSTRRGFYGLFHERRTPFLRPAGDRNFPKLAAAIRKRM